MKHLKGYTKRYFSLAVIALYSTLHKLCGVDSGFVYHKLSHKEPNRQTSPPFMLLYNKL